MVSIEIIIGTGLAQRSLGRTTGIEQCFEALKAAGVVRHSIMDIGNTITKYFATQAMDCEVKPRERQEIVGVEMVDGSHGTVRLWCDQWTAEVEA
jgi:hypothetical protein